MNSQNDDLDNLWAGNISPEVKHAMGVVNKSTEGQSTEICECGERMNYRAGFYTCPICDKGE